MGKKQKNQKTYTTASTFKINKKKSLSSNINGYIRLLKKNHPHLTSKQFLHLIHKFIHKFSEQKGSLPQSLVVETSSKIKICRKCDKWAIGTKKMVQCLLCQDFYHYECIQKDSQKEWVCQNCEKIVEKWQHQDDTAKQQNPKICCKCQKNKNQASIKCLKCSKYFHKQCYGKVGVVCMNCDVQIEKKIEKQKKNQRQLTLGQSFKKSQIESSKKKKSEEKTNKQSSKSSMEFGKSTLQLFGKDINKSEKQHSDSKNYIEKQQKKEESTTCSSSSLFSSSKRFSSSFPKMTPQQILKYKQNLLYAIISKNMEYTENLYCNNCTLEDENQNSVDFGILHLSMNDFKMFRQYKKQPIGPFLLEYRQKCGYDVVADKDLPKGMIVCQYVGDVYTSRGHINLQEQNDSVMELKKGKNADETLFIVPRRFTNIARFINGVNQYDPKRFQKQNVQTVRALVNGRPAVILYTCKAVKKGQSLLYNYGAGLNKAKYDTSNYE